MQGRRYAKPRFVDKRRFQQGQYKQYEENEQEVAEIGGLSMYQARIVEDPWAKLSAKMHGYNQNNNRIYHKTTTPKEETI